MDESIQDGCDRKSAPETASVFGAYCMEIAGRGPVALQPIFDRSIQHCILS
jgi:hypothetical protein